MNKLLQFWNSLLEFLDSLDTPRMMLDIGKFVDEQGLGKDD
ncbi:hypothetical protein J694_0703 [Acinetobacter sp. 1281984]|jgi:hypothetical protein|nr:hypothetical protein J627_2853 [Acinetobacter sp. 1245593]EXR29933.1 hypothetical protein J694_0703 [Acinetobacter sp. 1281984]